MSEIAAALNELGLLPAGLEEPFLAAEPPPPDSQVNLLPALLQCWRAFAASQPTNSAATHDAAAISTGLHRRLESGECWTWGWPGAAASRFSNWCGDRVACWPGGWQERKLVGIFSSRLSRQLERHRDWFAALRTACLRIDDRRECLLTVATTTTQRFVDRCGDLFGLPVLAMEVAKETEPAAAWGRRVLRFADDANQAAIDRVLLSPPVLGRQKKSATGSNSSLDGIPAADRVLASLSDRLIGLSIREGGHWQRLVQQRLSDPAFSPASLFLALGTFSRDESAKIESRASSERLTEALMQAGAVGWLLRHDRSAALGGERPPWSDPPLESAAADARIVAAAAICGEFLVHCTRSRPGPWPDQSAAEFLDDLLLDRSGADHSALAALSRIARSQRLLAAADLIRGGSPVVSFTAVPVQELSSLRTFRSHLARWDFEPYGIGIRREWLQARGTQPVLYGDEATWQSLSAADRPFFQRAKSATASGRIEDWTREREWRHLGDLALDTIPTDAAFLFVPTALEAELVAAISRWPVAVLASPSAPH